MPGVADVVYDVGVYIWIWVIFYLIVVLKLY